MQQQESAIGGARRTVDLIVPCYNEGEMPRLFYDAVSQEIQDMEGRYAFSFLFVDDGSKDGTLAEIKKLAAQHARVRYISFSRNFGKEAGIYAGLSHSHADFAVVIDADLQHPPALLRDMLRAVDDEGYDSCSARRVSREGEPAIRSFFSRLFYRLINRMSDVEIVDGAVDYRMMSRQMIQAVLSLGEVQRFSKGIFSWVGFRTKWVEFKNIERVVGETKWSFWKLFKYAVGGITAFTTAPLRLASFVGAGFLLLSFLLAAYELAKTLFFGSEVPGYPSTFIMLMLIGGVMSLSCGILGEYVARMYLEAKRRPVYIEKESDMAALEAPAPTRQPPQPSPDP